MAVINQISKRRLHHPDVVSSNKQQPRKNKRQKIKQQTKKQTDKHVAVNTGTASGSDGINSRRHEQLKAIPRRGGGSGSRRQALR